MSRKSSNENFFYRVCIFSRIVGANMALIIDNANRLGKTNTFANLIGLCTASYCHGALSILRVWAPVLNNNHLFLMIKVLGAVYLLYMGIKSMRTRLGRIENEKKWS